MSGKPNSPEQMWKAVTPIKHLLSKDYVNPSLSVGFRTRYTFRLAGAIHTELRDARRRDWGTAGFLKNLDLK